MRLLDERLQFCDFDDEPPPYAILSHTWADNNQEEVTYHDLIDGTSKSLLKLELCRGWAKAAGYDYFWIDTCCIDKRNDAEVSYAIRSMWRWYSGAGVCFVYLSDLSKKRKLDSDWRNRLKDCRWFTRGWTLQELVASRRVEFYALDGYIGSMDSLLPTLRVITGIDLGRPMPAHATRLNWISQRNTKRPEDKAYSMLGICDVSISPQYGEGGAAAWRRLEDAIRHRHGTVALEMRREVSSEDHRTAVLDALRFETIETRRNTVRVALARTCEWILGYPACAKWLKLQHKFFWIKGKPGAGKSVLIKYLDQYVTKKAKKSSTVVLHFYFNARGEQLEKSFLGLYRSLLVQLISTIPELAHELDTLSTQPSLMQLKLALSSAIRGLGKQVWLFVDALDECREGEVQELIDFLDGLQDAELYVCFASRHYPIVKVPTKLQLVLEEVDEHQLDLKTYVEKLDLQGQELAQMQHDIVAKSNGIFLWVVLVVEILQKDVDRGRFFAMQSRLREIPEGLPDLFKTIIFRDGEHKEEFMLCLRWILYSLRPLTLKEWYFAMMAGVGGSLEWNDGLTDQRMETYLLSSSKGLAEMTKGKRTTAQFIHESVRDFLIDQHGLRAICGTRESLVGVAHDQLKHCCLQGMKVDAPWNVRQTAGKKQVRNEREQHTFRTKYPVAEYAIKYILHHADQAASDVDQGDFLANDFDITEWTMRFNALQKDKPMIYGSTPSLNYLCAERDLARLMSRPVDALSCSRSQRYRAVLIAAIVNSSWAVLRVCLTDMAVHTTDEIIAEVKLQNKLVLLPRSLMDNTLRWVSSNGFERLSKHLLSQTTRSDVDSVKNELTAALYTAVTGGHIGMVRLLLNYGALVDGPEDRNLSAIPLCAASRQGHTAIVRMLLEHGANINFPTSCTNPLCEASARGHTQIVKLLLEAGANVNGGGFYKAPGNLFYSNGNALLAASCNASIDTVKLLLDAGGHVRAGGYWYARDPYLKCQGNALEAASRLGHAEVVELLRVHSDNQQDRYLA